MRTQDFEKLVGLYHDIYLYCLIGALIFLAIAIALFFLFKIPSVFGELTGRTARKAIDEMISENAESGALTSKKVDHEGRRRRKNKTGTLGNTGNLRKNNGRMSRKIAEDTPNSMPEVNTYTQQTEPMDQYDTYGSQETDVLDTYGSQETDVLDTYGSQETSVLDTYESQETGELNGFTSQETEAFCSNGVLYQAPESETMVLDQSLMNMNTGFVFEVERSIVEIHTEEVI